LAELLLGEDCLAGQSDFDFAGGKDMQTVNSRAARPEQPAPSYRKRPLAQPGIGKLVFPVESDRVIQPLRLMAAGV
jgi:hypothetical protein